MMGGIQIYGLGGGGEKSTRRRYIRNRSLLPIWTLPFPSGGIADQGLELVQFGDHVARCEDVVEFLLYFPESQPISSHFPHKTTSILFGHQPADRKKWTNLTLPPQQGNHLSLHSPQRSRRLGSDGRVARRHVVVAQFRERVLQAVGKDFLQAGGARAGGDEGRLGRQGRRCGRILVCCCFGGGDGWIRVVWGLRRRICCHLIKSRWW